MYRFDCAPINDHLVFKCQYYQDKLACKRTSQWALSLCQSLLSHIQLRTLAPADQKIILKARPNERPSSYLRALVTSWSWFDDSPFNMVQPTRQKPSHAHLGEKHCNTWWNRRSTFSDYKTSTKPLTVQSESDEWHIWIVLNLGSQRLFTSKFQPPRSSKEAKG